MEGIAKVWPEAWSRFPVFIDAEAPLVGKPINGDGVLLGVPYEAVARDLPGYTEENPEGGRAAWQWEEGQTVPIALPDFDSKQSNVAFCRRIKDLLSVKTIIIGNMCLTSSSRNLITF